MKTIIVIVLVFIAHLSFSQITPNCVDAASELTSALASSSTPGRVNLSWTRANGIPGVGAQVSYFYEISLNGGPFSFNGAGTALGVQLDLLPGSNYRFVVRTDAICNDLGTDLSDNIESAPFSVLTYPAIPTLDEVTSRSTAQATSINFSWSGVSGIVSGYDIEISNAGGVVQTQSVTSTSFAAVGLTTGTNYTYRVRAKNATGASSFTPSSSSIITRPASPVFNAPSSITTNSFNISWPAVTGAASYQLDVSSSNFSTLLTNYNNLALSGTSQSITGLTAGTTYQYRVRAVNTSGVSANSSPTTSVITLPSAPVTNVPTNITTNSFDISWAGITGASSYKLDVSSNNFVTLLSSYNNLTVNGTTQTVSGLSPGTVYNYRVRAVNASGASANSSSSTSLITLSLPPTANSPTNITINSFNANWSAASGAASYRLDVSSDNFATLLTNYNDLTVNGTTQIITSLDAGTNYSYRLRTVNASGNSGNSNSVAIITLPSAPVTNPPTNITTHSFTVSWPPVIGASSYQLDVATDNLFATTLLNYSNLSITGTSQSVTQLNEGTYYYYRLRAVNSGGTSVNSNVISLITLTAPPLTNSATNITTTSFKANWQPVIGASGYQLDVSADNFATFLTNYNNLSVIGTSLDVNGLNAGTNYSYRVRAVNESGTSANSVDAISLITLPDVPVGLAASNISVNSFTANWQMVAGAASYQLDVTTDNFTTLLTTYNNFTVNGTAQSVTGLNSGNSYSYRVRAVNTSGSSIYSNLVSLITLPSPPVSIDASNITANSFTANWQLSSGAGTYQLDISDNNFDTTIKNYSNLPPTTTSQNITGLVSGTNYSYRVRAVNSNNGISDNSTIITLLTLPGLPQSFTTSDNQATSIKINWTAVKSATEYQLQVSTSASFTTLLPGYDPKIIASSFTSTVVGGLTPATIYYFRLVTRNSTGLSDFSSQTSSTLNADGTTTPLDVATPVFPQTFASGQQNDISISAAGGTGTLSVDFYHKKNSELTFTKESIPLSNGSYKVTTHDDWFDSFGMEFYFEVHDLTNQVKLKKDNTDQPFKILTSVADVLIPILDVGNELKNYQMISIPYQLPGRPQVHDAFEQVTGLGEYDKKKWRLYRYQDGVNVEYSDGVKASNLQQGLAYWFISKNQIELSLGQGNSFGNSIRAPFTMFLKKGWNQIGNPFPYHLSWQDVLKDNPNSTIGNLFVFDKNNVSYVQSDLFKAYEGGFVLADKDESITFKVTLPKKNGGRLKGSSESDSFNNSNAWIVPIILAQGEVVNSLNGVGMHPEAQEGKDRYDKITPPRFLRYAELNSRKSDYPFDLSTDVVNLSDNYDWFFEIESNSNQPVELIWNKLNVNSTGGQLILHDQTKHVLIDMAARETYSTMAGSSIVIHYKKKIELINPMVELGAPYPNPFDKETIIPYYYSNAESFQAVFTITDVTGRVLFKRIANSFENESGYQMMRWQGTTIAGDEVAPGLYFYKIIVHTEKDMITYTGELVRQ